MRSPGERAAPGGEVVEIRSDPWSSPLDLLKDTAKQAFGEPSPILLSDKGSKAKHPSRGPVGGPRVPLGHSPSRRVVDRG